MPVEIKAVDKNGYTNLDEVYTYNEYNDLTQKSITGYVTQSYTYGYKANAAHDLDYVLFGNYKFKPLSDVNSRNTGKEIYDGESKIAAEYISYVKVGDHATTMPSTVWFASGSEIEDSIKYKYDKCGNICDVIENGHTVARYKYDALNRLIREDNKVLNKTVLFSYDNNGNITERCEYAYTLKDGDELAELECNHIDYIYDGDRLISYNGEKCAYNAVGNPTTYRDKTVTWKNAKTLYMIGNNGFEYDGQGRIYAADSLFVYDSDGRLVMKSNGLEFIYDNSGLAGVKYNGATYFYRKDIQGNIIALLDNAGNVVVKYVYDAWGNHAVINADGEEVTEGIGVLNPFRYRGYYYDTNTGLYYLQTRFYDPEVGRFISQDSIEYADPETINGLNLYAYCGNNPVMAVDPDGTSWKSFWNSLGGKILGTILVVAAVVLVSVLTAGVGSGVASFLGGGAIASIIGGAVGGAISGAIIGAGMSIIDQGISNGYGNINWGQVGIDASINAGIGAIMGAVFEVGGRTLGLLGKTKWAQRPLSSYSEKSVNYFFGSVGKEGSNFTFLRLGKGFRVEASTEFGLHYHMKTASIGLSVHRTKLIKYIWNSMSGLVGYWARQ